MAQAACRPRRRSGPRRSGRLPEPVGRLMASRSCRSVKLRPDPVLPGEPCDEHDALTEACARRIAGNSRLTTTVRFCASRPHAVRAYPPRPASSSVARMASVTRMPPSLVPRYTAEPDRVRQARRARRIAGSRCICCFGSALPTAAAEARPGDRRAPGSARPARAATPRPPPRQLRPRPPEPAPLGFDTRRA